MAVDCPEAVIAALGEIAWDFVRPAGDPFSAIDNCLIITTPNCGGDGLHRVSIAFKSGFPYLDIYIKLFILILIFTVDLGFFIELWHTLIFVLFNYVRFI